MGLKRIGRFKSEIVSIKEVPKGYNISYSNEFKTNTKARIAVIPVGYMDGLNVKNGRDSFNFKNNIISICMEIKKLFTKPTLKVIIKDRKFNVIGRIGMYHAIVDITGANDINLGDEVYLSIAPIYTNLNIRREYI